MRVELPSHPLTAWMILGSRMPKEKKVLGRAAVCTYHPGGVVAPVGGAEVPERLIPAGFVLQSAMSDGQQKRKGASPEQKEDVGAQSTEKKRVLLRRRPHGIRAWIRLDSLGFGL